MCCNLSSQITHTSIGRWSLPNLLMMSQISLMPGMLQMGEVSRSLAAISLKQSEWVSEWVSGARGMVILIDRTWYMLLTRGWQYIMLVHKHLNHTVEAIAAPWPAFQPQSHPQSGEERAHMAHCRCRFHGIPHQAYPRGGWGMEWVLEEWIQ